MAIKQAWQQALSDLVTDPEELLALLELSPLLLPAAKRAAIQFPLKVPREFVGRIKKGDLNDPLLRQILPLDAELAITSGFTQDPLSEKAFNPIPGLLHKYHGRVLVTLTSACAIHCRYCFRRFFPYNENNPGKKGWEKLFAYIAQDKTISEIILSGGDPLSVSERVLAEFSAGLHAISHLKRLRLHTRLPIVIPSRITKEFITWLDGLPWEKTLVLHVNHPQEINDEVIESLRPLRQLKLFLLNQAVLLKGVNDDAKTLALLSEKLQTAGILPYYLHLLDPVQGSAHFAVPLSKAKALHQTLASSLPGYLVPRLVEEQAGAPAKTVLSTSLFTA